MLPAGCSTPGEPEPIVVPSRPGSETGTQAVCPASIRFEPAQASIDCPEIASGSFQASLHRAGENLPDTTYYLGIQSNDIGMVCRESVQFVAGQTTASIDMTFSCTLLPQQERSASISVKAHPDSAAVIFTLCVKRPTQWEVTKHGKLVYRGIIRDGRLEMRHTTAATDYRLCFDQNEDEEAVEFKIDPNGLTYTGLTARKGGQVFDSRLISVVQEDENLYFVSKDLPMNLMPGCSLTDGWLLGVVSLEARPPLVPAQNPWRVLVLENQEHEGELYLVDPYRAPSPLDGINAFDGLSVIEIDATDGTEAKILAQEAGFVNSDLFAQPFIIGGYGSIGKMSGGRKITLTPLHNGKGSYPGQWANNYKSEISMPPFGN